MPKPFLTYVQQIQKLKDKNLVIPDEPSAAAILHRYGYFALITGYKDLLKNRTTKRYLDAFVIYMAKIKAHIWTSTSTIFRLPSKNAKWTS